MSLFGEVSVELWADRDREVLLVTLKPARSKILSLLAGVAALALHSSPATAATFTLDVGPEAFFVDGNPNDILAAGFELDLVSGVLSDFVVIGDGATLYWSSGNMTLDPIAGGFQLVGGVATLTVAGGSSSIQDLSGTFTDLGLGLTFQFFGNGQGIPAPPDLDALLFVASDSGGTLPSLTPPGAHMPEPTGLLLFAIGLLLCGRVLRSRSRA